MNDLVASFGSEIIEIKARCFLETVDVLRKNPSLSENVSGLDFLLLENNGTGFSELFGTSDELDTKFSLSVRTCFSPLQVQS